MFTDRNIFLFSDPLCGRLEFQRYGFQEALIKRIFNPEWKRHVVCRFRNSGTRIAYQVFAHERMLQGESSLFITYGNNQHRHDGRKITVVDYFEEQRVVRNSQQNCVKDRVTDATINTINFRGRNDEDRMRGHRYTVDYVFILNANLFDFTLLMQQLEMMVGQNTTIVIDGTAMSRDYHNTFQELYRNTERLGYKRSTIRHFVHPKFNRNLVMEFIRSYGVDAYRQMFECRM